MKEYVDHVVEIEVIQTRRYTVSARTSEQAEDEVLANLADDESMPFTLIKTDTNILESYQRDSETECEI